MTSAAQSKTLLGLGTSELERWAVLQGQSAFRGRQLHDWLYAKGAKDLQDITVLPKSWRESLQESGVSIGRLKEQDRKVAADATTKLLLGTDDDLDTGALRFECAGERRRRVRLVQHERRKMELLHFLCP